jgi:4-hydroxy-3-methylbut-2-enyl diphosphate reductase
MKVTKAKALGTCFGVQDAIDLALDFDHKEDLTILGQLVHNPQRVKRLNESGITVATSLDEPITTQYVMITAHGAANQVKEELLNRGHAIIDASCPLVVRVHKAIKKIVSDGFFPIVIGQKEHVEVRGIVGDLDVYEVIGSIDEIDKVKKYPRLGIVSQTTQQISRVHKIVEAIEAQGHEEVKFVDTVCKPTKDRQTAVEELSEQVDLMLVIGGFNSSNTKKLKLVCERKGLPAYHIEGINDIYPEWFSPDDHIGITAGTSTPSNVIEEVCAYLYDLKLEEGLSGS